MTLCTLGKFLLLVWQSLLFCGRVIQLFGVSIVLLLCGNFVGMRVNLEVFVISRNHVASLMDSWVNCVKLPMGIRIYVLLPKTGVEQDLVWGFGESPTFQQEPIVVWLRKINYFTFKKINYFPFLVRFPLLWGEVAGYRPAQTLFSSH